MSSGSGGGGVSSGGTSSGGSKVQPNGGTATPGGSAGTGARSGKGGAGGRAGAPNTGAVGGISGGAGVGAFPTGGSFTGGNGGGVAGGPQKGGAGGVAGAPGECKSFCSSISRLCLGIDTDYATCSKDCYAAFTQQMACRQETLNVLNCITKAASALSTTGRCISDAELIRFCGAEIAQQAMCSGTPTPLPMPTPTPAPPACSESGSTAPGSCVLVRECGSGDYAVFQCTKSAAQATASCECWVNGTLKYGTTLSPDSSVEKACYDPALAAPCQPF